MSRRARAGTTAGSTSRAGRARASCAGLPDHDPEDGDGDQAAPVADRESDWVAEASAKFGARRVALCCEALREFAGLALVAAVDVSEHGGQHPEDERGYHPRVA